MKRGRLSTEDKEFILKSKKTPEEIAKKLKRSVEFINKVLEENVSVPEKMTDSVQPIKIDFFARTKNAIVMTPAMADVSDAVKHKRTIDETCIMKIKP